MSYLNGISVFPFSLSVNVSTLNRWQTRALVLSGDWKDTNPEIDMGADVAADIVEEPAEAAPEFIRTLADPIEAGGLGYVRRGLLNEDEALKFILQSSPLAFSPDTRSSLGFHSQQQQQPEEAGEDVEDSEVAVCDEQQELRELKMYSSVIEEDEMDARDSPQSSSPTLEWDNPVLEPLAAFSPCLAEEMKELTMEEEEVGEAATVEAVEEAVEEGERRQDETEETWETE